MRSAKSTKNWSLRCTSSHSTVPYRRIDFDQGIQYFKVCRTHFTTVPPAGGYPIPGYPPRLDGGTSIWTWLGYPPIQTWPGYPLSKAGWGYPPVQGWMGVSPIWTWLGTPPPPPRSKAGWGTPCPRLDGGTPLSKAGWGYPSVQGWMGTPHPRLDGATPTTP